MHPVFEICPSHTLQGNKKRCRGGERFASVQSNWGSSAWEWEDVSGCDTMSGMGSMEEQ